jgi:predicted transcriptional regulator
MQSEVFSCKYEKSILDASLKTKQIMQSEVFSCKYEKSILDAEAMGKNVNFSFLKSDLHEGTGNHVCRMQIL